MLLPRRGFLQSAAYWQSKRYDGHYQNGNGARYRVRFWAKIGCGYNIISASNLCPESNSIPRAVTVLIVSVITLALPVCSALKKSPSGQKHRRSSHKLYFGEKCGS